MISASVTPRPAKEPTAASIQARVLPTDALEIVGEEEAAQVAGAYAK